MDSPLGVFGYGYSLEGRFADVEEIEADEPVRGPDCPPTADFVELALGQASTELEAVLRTHLTTECLYCVPRFEAQQRALEESQRLSASAVPPRTAIATELRIRRNLVGVGEGRFIPVHKGDTVSSCVPIEWEGVITFPTTTGRLELKTHLLFSRRGEDRPWHLTLRLPSALRGNTAAGLDRLDGQQVKLALILKNRKDPLQVDLRLEADQPRDNPQRELVSHPEPIPQLLNPCDLVRIEYHGEKKE